MSRVIVGMLFAAAGVMAMCAPIAAQPPGQKPPQKKENEPPAVSVRFRNDTKFTVVIQGASEVRGMVRRGQPILIREGRSGFESNVPVGVRLITIVDYNQPSRPLLQNFPLPVDRDLQVLIRTDPKNPQRLVLTPDSQ